MEQRRTERARTLQLKQSRIRKYGCLYVARRGGRK